MKKAKKIPEPYKVTDSIVPIVEEPQVTMRKISTIPAAMANFSYTKFQKIAKRVPFTLPDWAGILHLSERTLQRYAKDNKNFEGIYVDRILQIEKLILMGLEVFLTADDFYKWLKTNKNIMGTQTGFDGLYHTEGINRLIDHLGRIQHGVYA